MRLLIGEAEPLARGRKRFIVGPSLINKMAEITSAKATAKTVRVSPRKTRLVIDLIRGKRVADAIAILKFTPTKAAVEVENVLNSAIANAENNFGLEKANLVVSETFINEGPTMKR